ncbi:DUF427 domain-containing protein [Mycobacterium sp.]|uniref:DUF427 domain-containing protein n=1 Tax=Mycobacterium sp. TaxID=1785 RepID=UPI003BAB97B6
MRVRPQTPGPGQESVWDYPRPPRLEWFGGRITVEIAGQVIVSTSDSWRVLETSHPPTYYLPRAAFGDGVLQDAPGESWCEWKGKARYFDIVAESKVARKAAWNYPNPTSGFEPIAQAVAVMAGQVDRCTVNGEEVVPQPGDFYGGWITSWVVGPFKGDPGSMGW